MNEEADGPVEVALPTADGDRELPATEVAFTVAEGEDTKFPAIIGAYDAVASWAKHTAANWTDRRSRSTTPTAASSGSRSPGRSADGLA